MDPSLGRDGDDNFVIDPRFCGKENIWDDNLKKHIFLTGFMGSGKSTIGKKLAKRLNLKFIDTDARIELSQNTEIREIFKIEGESRFRGYEESILEEILKRGHRAVISLGGGTLLSNANIKKVLNSGILIYVKSSPSEIWNRIKHSTRRPLLRKEGEEWTRQMYLDRIAELMKERENGYKQAHLVLDRDGKEVNEIVEQILLKIEDNS
jgi:shikimate kinase